MKSIIHGLKTLMIKPKVLKRYNSERKSWVTQKELPKIVFLIIWITKTDHNKELYLKMIGRFCFIWDTAGSDFLFKYLKEVMRLTVRRLAGIELNPSKKIFVKLNKLRFPAIIPLEICTSMTRTWHRLRVTREVIGILSVISIFRILPTSVKPDFQTIIAPFTGTTKTLDDSLIKVALKNLKINKFEGKLGITVKGSLKSGPNGTVSLLTSSLDAFAFCGDPLRFYYMVSFSLKTYGLIRGGLWSLWLFTVLLASSPYLILSVILGARMPIMAKLSVVYDQAGKARIVGIINSWIQSILYPLHKFLFHLLEKISMDGTFDQTRPFDQLLARVSPEQILYGFDLTAATDRLPIDLQKQILSLIGFSGNDWFGLLNTSYKSSIGFIKYSVGQPMGAYTSFAMLAITHHVIVQVAAQRAGVSGLFREYCLLGDDIVIAHDAVALEYQNLMSLLGLDIQVSKSVISSKFTEFAKRLKGKNLDYSPVGAGLLLFTVRNKYYICVLIYEMLVRGLCNHRNVFPQFIDALPKKYLRYRSLINWFVSSHLRRSKNLSDHYLMNLRKTYVTFFLTGDKSIPLLEVMLAHIKEDLMKLWLNIKHTFNKGIFVTHSRVGLPDFSELFLLPILPSTYIIIKEWCLTFNDITKHFGVWWSFVSKGESHDILDIMDHLERDSALDINISEKDKVKLTLDNVYKLNKIINSSLLLQNLFERPFGWQIQRSYKVDPEARARWLKRSGKGSRPDGWYRL
nr:RNA-dependent RNA polymerase [Valsa mali mitovirus 1]